MSYVERKIELTISLGKGATLNPNSDNTVTLTQHRVQANITQNLGPTVGKAMIRVYGLNPSLLNKVASLNKVTATLQENLITVKAGDDASGMSIVFDGMIVLAQADMGQQPTTALNITANALGALALQKTPVNTYPGSADLAIVMQNLATQAGLNFENWGASKVVATPYFWGSVGKQIDDCARAGGFERVFEKNTLIIWPKVGARGGVVPLISKASGLIGYPSYLSVGDKSGISVTTVFDPRLYNGGMVQIDSELPVAKGRWQVYELTHELESMVPGGQWLSHFAGLAPQAVLNG